MWSGLWPGVPEDEVPIRHITNGVHPRSWISHDIQDLLVRYLGPPDEKYGPEVSVWEQVDNIADEELWHTHERRRSPPPPCRCRCTMVHYRSAKLAPKS